MKPRVRLFLACSLLSATATGIAAAQSPFQFREAYFLERRLNGIGKDYEIGHPEQFFHTGPDPANQTVIDTRAVASYADYRTLGPIISSIADIRRRGGIKVAEARYLECVEMIRKAQGPDSSDEALVLDWIGEFYLELRDFDRAYQKFSEALRIARIVVERTKNDPDDNRRALPQFGPGRLHLADVLTRLGQLDMARGDLVGAGLKLDEAIEIDNKAAYLTFENRLDAIYFKSLVLEKQEKWQDAETLWRDAIARREKVGNEPYWDTRKELAAMFARHGDFHSAAKEAGAVIAGTANQQLHRAKTGMYWLNLRGSSDTWSIYENESNNAMQDILAVDRWLTDSPNAAAPLVGNPTHVSIEQGSDADILRLYSLIEKKVFIKMSILLDGNPTPERVVQAYHWFSEVKGQYLATHIGLSRRMDEDILNPGVSGGAVHLPEELANANERYANTFLSLALDNHGVTPEQLRQSVSTEQTIQEGALARCFLWGCTPGRASYNLTADAAVVDFTAWNRLDRNHPSGSKPEYGAFVQREGRPVVYVRLGSREDIDKSLDELELGVDGFFQGRTGNPEELRHTLQSLYSLVLAPLESSLKGASQLLVIPDGRLSMIPLGGLMDGQGHYFLERHTVTYLNSKLSGSQSGAASAPVVLANPDFDMALPGSPQAPLRETLAFKPLPGAEREAGYVAETLHLPADRVLTGRNAREELLHSIRNPEILHLATHSDPFLRARLPLDQFPTYDLFEFPSLLLAQDPFLHSVIALAGANRPQAGPEDGLLTGLEVASLHLAGTRLVVLSSCQSANGKLVDGQGIPGLRAAFSAAGARSLLMNLWPVDDEAGFEFMKFFYSHLALGAAEAMRQAQLHMLNDARYKNPLYWAGYTYSDNEALIPDTSRPKPSAPTPVVTAAKAPAQEVSIAPRCFQLTGHAEKSENIRFTVRIKLARVARYLSNDPRIADRSAIYDLHLPGNVIDVIREVNGTPMPDDASADKSGAAKLIVQKIGNSSAILIQSGSPFFQISLGGPLGLFPTLDPPETLPSLSAYSAAAANSLDGPVKIETIGTCDPPTQNDDKRATGNKAGPASSPVSEASKKSLGPDNPSSTKSSGAAAPAAKSSAADIPAFQSLQLKPRCFQLSGVSDTYPGIDLRFTARIRLAAARTMQTSSDNGLAYDLSLPGNEITIIPEVNGKPAEGGISVVGAEKSFAEKSFLVISRDADSSTFSLKIGHSQPPSYIGLKGPPDLFPTFDIPEALPPLRLYREASIHLLGEHAKVDTVSACETEPQQQYNESRITASSQQAPVPSEHVAKIAAAAAAHTSTPSTEATATQALKAVPSVQAGGESLVAPRCFQFSGVSSTTPGFTTRFTARITLGGVVRKVIRAEQIAIYDIHLPGNEVAIVYDINGTQTSNRYTLSSRDSLTLTVIRTGSGSSISIRTADGDTKTDWIVMEGPPDLFPTVDIPETLPSPSSYTQALVQGSRADSIGFCEPEPLIRYNDGKFRINPSVPSGASEGRTNSAPAPVTGSGSKSAASVTGAGTKSGTAIPASDQNSGIARQILAYALRGESQSVFKHLTPDADRAAIGAMVGFLSGSANKLGNCPAEGIEVHKILWAARNGRSAPAYVVIGDCEKARPRLLLFMDNNGLVSRTGSGGIISKTTSDQIKQRAQNLAESLLRGNFAAFADNFSPSMPPQFQNVSAIINSAVQNLGSFEKISASQKFPYADVVVVTAVYQRGAVNVEISLDPALRIAAWYAQTADKPGYFWQEFRDLQ